MHRSWLCNNRVKACIVLIDFLQVMDVKGCPTQRNALVYKLRAADHAVINTYPAMSRAHKSIVAR